MEIRIKTENVVEVNGVGQDEMEKIIYYMSLGNLL